MERDCGAEDDAVCEGLVDQDLPYERCARSAGTRRCEQKVCIAGEEFEVGGHVVRDAVRVARVDLEGR